MIELYSLTSAARVIMAILCFIAMLMETLIVIFTAQRRKENHVRLLYESSLVLFFFASAFIFGLVQHVVADRLFYVMDYFRYTAALSAVFAVWSFARRPSIRMGAAIPALLVILPVFDSFTGGHYPAIFIAVNTILFMAAMEKLMLAWKALHDNLSSLSIKQAFDSIPDGLLFANIKGRILLKNNTMDAILRLCRINPLLNAQKIYAAIGTIGATEYCECVRAGDALLLRILNNGTYLITLAPLHSGGRQYLQLFAADITEEDILTKELDEYALRLADTQKAMIDALNNIEKIERAKELLRLKQNIHDIIGQRLSIVHRFLEDMDSGRLSVENLRELFGSLESELNAAFSAAPLETFEEIQNLFSLIGVSVTLTGKLPDEKAVKSILLQVIREASTNAIRHGNAKKIEVNAADNLESFCMTITNDGSIPNKSIVEGNGISSMRQCLGEIGGELYYEQSPKFLLRIIINESSGTSNQC
ncbi:MAG: hypothetical protein Q4C12_06375 [Clostridia bacterium]|nr:hypothetical protein [Clostridia bacterium]